MGGERGRSAKGSEATGKEVGRFRVDDYYREYYDLYDMDWDVIKEGTRRGFRTGITWCKIYAWAFVVIGIGFAALAWYSRPIPSFHLHFLEFEWLMTFMGLFFAVVGWVHYRKEARWREEVIRRYENPSSPLVARERGLDREGASKPSYF